MGNRHRSRLRNWPAENAGQCAGTVNVSYLTGSINASVTIRVTGVKSCLSRSNRNIRYKWRRIMKVVDPSDDACVIRVNTRVLKK